MMAEGQQTLLGTSVSTVDDDELPEMALQLFSSCENNILR
jgi:hypothetical protein